MDKKQLFQKQLLQSKIDQNLKELSILQISYNELKLQSEFNTITTIPNTNTIPNNIFLILISPF